MSQEHNAVITDFDFAMIADFFRGLEQGGPGGEKETLEALNFIKGYLPRQPKVADIGCGSGRQSATLAKAIDCTVTAVDLLPEMVEEVEKRVSREGLQGRVSALKASMDALPFADEEFDLLWAEGSVYNMGFENGLRYWRKFLKSGGFVALTDCTWLKNSRPDDTAYFADNFPEIANISEKIAIMERAGYAPVASFVLPERCWTENYYAPIRKRMEWFGQKYAGNPTAEFFIGRLHEEIAVYERLKEYYGYVFYIGRKCD